MKRVTIAAFLLPVVLCFTTTAFGQNPHFISVGATFNGAPEAGDLNVSWKEAGLGDNQLINYTASADATATYGCINGGGNHPKATNKETVSGPVSASGAFNSGKNGSISATLTLTPPGPGSFSCPSGQTLALGEVSYTNVTLTDETNGLTENIIGTFSTVVTNFK